MSTSQTVARHLPYLRRYARALVGSQSAGDAYVVATLESIIADRQALETKELSRTALYRLFTKIWNSVSLNSVAEPGGMGLPVERRLSHVTPLPRQAFLLIALEEFSEHEAAEILEIPVTELRTLVDECGRELAADIATDVLIVEDEPFIALDLQSLVESLGHRVIGTARTRDEALAIARDKRPGLILADIQLADGSSGIDTVNDLLESFEAPVIFITAYSERFLTGERPEPAFLIAKPYQPAMVSAILSQALFFERKATRRGRGTTAQRGLNA
jgi:DNA-directed RNA polymerase specialized sigma24 family protein/CheY-like chemotaxis protein